VLTSICCRYHRVETTRLMLAYRVGKIQQPWTNFVPPLRGGVFRKFGSDEKAEDASSEDEDGSTWGTDSTHSDNLSRLNTPSPCLGPIVLEAGTLEKDTQPLKAPLLTVVEEKGNEWHHAAIRKRSNCPPGMSREAYTAALEQQEISNDIQAYPSLDVETQLAIRKEYQELHERVKAAGHYQCRYSEYGKDSIRFAIVFGIFLYLVYAKWYLMSGVMLGLWWVCYRLDPSEC
jgi:delta8-fatty-acid desaturase